MQLSVINRLLLYVILFKEIRDFLKRIADMCILDREALVNPTEFGKRHVFSPSLKPLQRSAQIKSSGFDTLSSIIELGTILRISFLECKSAVDLRFIFLHRVVGTTPTRQPPAQLASTWDYVPVPALGNRQRKYRATSISNGSRS